MQRSDARTAEGLACAGPCEQTQSMRAAMSTVVPLAESPPEIYETLQAREVPRVLEAAGRWRNLVATALCLGLRKGELFALSRADVRLDDRMLFVRRSHARDTVKGARPWRCPSRRRLQP